MDLVTSEAGISKQTLYRYYETKESLFSDFLNQTIQELTEEKEPSLASLPIPENREQLYAILLKMAQVISQKLANPTYIAILRIVFAESGCFPELSDCSRRPYREAPGC